MGDAWILYCMSNPFFIADPQGIELLVICTLKPEQKGHHVTNKFFKYPFLTENFQVLIEISLQFISNVSSHYMNQSWQISDV